MNHIDIASILPTRVPPAAVKTTAILAATTALMALGLGAASAHVSVTPDSTSAGGSTQLTFRVPSESETAFTNKVEVQLPTDTPFTSVRALPVEGWTAEIVRGDLPEPVMIEGAEITEAPLSVIWTADDEEHSLSAEEYQNFSLSARALPEEGTIINLPTIQSYSDGSVSNWDQPTEEIGVEPDDGAPSFVTTAEGAGHGATPTGTAEEATEESSAGAGEVEPAATEQASTASSTSPVTWIALIAGLVGLIAGVLAFIRSGKTRTN
ncbi:YcnI family protein [Arthrobacter sp. AET 35A]|uniref:YcnI family copper-binding membrane protein n=1 Tax=Arthrobacter sp. AET 35A TaxID=2292643 RepID=UPI001784D2DA|nr:YcnI family protein [Arthrobacter sp. AET 35A]MBE0011013.1 DUF1775 domain-containing protein [Arthrobacter sp. AET 35A]